ncbi:hypothetical protein GQ53DRAFT_667469 [Thozetella sp. PMI_491]|nr:hypothetical protein GQ53DRAFT_667469 [Thozetella sp. PMI_491]
MAAKRAASAALESIPNRSIYLRVKPAPVGLSERRSVLRALQQYGEIEVFKKQQDDSSFISVAAQHTTASDLVNSSPLQYEYAGDASPSRPATGTSSKFGSAARRVFNVEIFPAQDYRHKARISQSPLYGPWPDERNLFNDSRSFALFALRSAVPWGIAQKGLVDWESCGQVEAETEDRTDKLFHIMDRKRRRDQARLVKEIESRMGRADDSKDPSAQVIIDALEEEEAEFAEEHRANRDEPRRDP